MGSWPSLKGTVNINFQPGGHDQEVNTQCFQQASYHILTLKTNKNKPQKPWTMSTSLIVSSKRRSFSCFYSLVLQPTGVEASVDVRQPKSLVTLTIEILSMTQATDLCVPQEVSRGGN